MTSVGSNSTAPSTLLQQLEIVMNNKEKENEELRRRVELLETILKQHGICSVVAVEKNHNSAEDKDDVGVERVLTPHDDKQFPSVESNTTDTETESESESVSSLTSPDDATVKTTKDKDIVVRSKRQKPRLFDFKKVSTICEEDSDEEDGGGDDDVTVQTTTTNATGYTKRSLIMLPEDQRQKEAEPYPQGTSAGGRWYRQNKDQSVAAKPWTQRLACHCGPDDVDPVDEEYIYYDRQGSRKYYSPEGKEVENPIQKKGTTLKVLPHDGTILAYYKKMGLPLYHQKQRTGKQKLRVSDFSSKEVYSI